jgi:PIN domain nuclease of toxin-antitoxin system
MLLDTHTLLWLTLSPTHLSKVASKAISKHLKENGSVLVSAAAFWEISVKIEKKKLDLKQKKQFGAEEASIKRKLEDAELNIEN